MSDTVTRLMALAARRFKADAAKLRAEADFFETLGIDSVQALELLSELELEFDVEIPDYELQGVKTFTALAERIDKRR
ncbi:MAG: acyl carrier protein [Planctomycetes bacterium]|nr:acyl carrier protein [Planctomycetota bacterium]